MKKFTGIFALAALLVGGCAQMKADSSVHENPSVLEDSRRNAGMNTDSIEFFSLRINADKVDKNAVINDILFYDGDKQNIMDTRAFLYGNSHKSVTNILDGNPATQMNKNTGLKLKSDMGIPLGYRTSHLIVNTPTPEKLSGMTLLFKNSIRRPLVTVDLGILKNQQEKALAWRIDLPSLKVSPVKEIPENTYYKQLDLSQYFAKSARFFDMTKSKTLENFKSKTRWEVTKNGAEPRFTVVTSPGDVKKSKTIGYTVDGNKGSKWCISFSPGLTWLAKLEKPEKIDSYSFTSGSDCPERDPKEWVLEGSIDGKKWEKLDHQKNQPMIDGRCKKKTYNIKTNKAYDQYRFRFLKFYGGIKWHLFQVAEIQLGDLNLKPSKEVSLTLKDTKLKPGESVAISCDVNSFLSKFGVSLGKNPFTLEKLEKLTVPNGDEYQVQREDGADPFRQTIVLTRGSGKNSSKITWHILGIRHDSMGSTTLVDDPKADLPISLFFIPLAGGADQISIDRVIVGELQKPLPSLPTVTKWQKLPPIDITKTPRYGRDFIKKLKEEEKFQKVSNPYGKITPEELASFKKAIAFVPYPCHNDNNRLTFGDMQATQALYFMVKASDDKELLGLLEKWCDSILAWRNGGKHYSIPFYSEYLPNPGLEVGKAHPVWNHFMGRRYVQGKVHYFDDLSAGSAGPCALLMYPKYVAAHPEIWDKPCAEGDITHLEKAKKLIKEAELTLNNFTIKHFADPVTGRIPKPWNRYAELIEACVILEEIYDRLKDHDDIYDKDRLATYHRVVDGYVEYIFDPRESYSEKVIERDGKKYTVMNFGYAPKYLEWGSKSELIWYMGMDFGALIHVYASGRHTDTLSDARAMILRNTLRYLTYQGRDKDGNMKLGVKLNGDGAGVRTWALGQMMAAYLDPAFYDEFIGDLIKKSNGMTSFGNTVWIRDEMRERGVVEPGKRNLPKAVIETSATKIQPGGKIVFSAGKSTGDGLKFEWDLNRDGKPEFTTPTIEKQFSKLGNYFVLLKVTDKNGLSAFDQITVTVSPIGQGKGAGHIIGKVWEKAGGSGIDQLTRDTRFPNSPDQIFKAKSLELPKSFGDNYGTMLEAYIIPPKNAEYTFFITSDDQSEFYLSNDANPANAAALASVPEYANKRVKGL